MSISAGWSEGYVTDTLYTDHVFREQSPAWINYVAGLMGCAPRPLDRPFAYLELGCGLGHSITVFAAAFPQARFVGVDFNPAHIDHAQRRARALGLDNLTFVEASFQDLAADHAGTGVARGLGHFDFVTLHGIYSWISLEARQAVQRLIFDRLLPGGLVYNSYNCLPGWSVEAPLQRLMKEFASVGSGGSSARMRAALAQMKTLAGAKTGYFGAHAQAQSALEQYARKQDNYLAHEFLNGAWNAFYAADVADEMSLAKLDFVGSATLMENHGDLLLAEGALALVNQQPDERRRQMVQDFLVNQKFRRDIFVRGHARLGRAEIAANRARQCLVAPKSLANVSPNVKVRRGAVNFDAAKFKQLVAVAGEWAGTEGEMGAAFAKAAGGSADFSRMLAILTTAGHLLPAAMVPPRPRSHPATEAGQVARHAMPLHANQAELASAIARKVNVTLASPVSGNATAHALNEALMINELLQAGGPVADIIARMEAKMAAIGVRLAKDGKTVTDPAAAAAQLKGMIEGFVANDLPGLIRLGVLSPAP